MPTPTPPQYSVTDLGTLGGTYSYATGVNHLGQVTGYSQVAPSPSPGFIDHGFVWTPTSQNGTDGTMSDLDGTFPYNNRAYGINGSGEVTGYWIDPISAKLRAFIYMPGSTSGVGGGPICDIDPAFQNLFHQYPTMDRLVKL